MQRIRVATIDSGVNPTHPHVQPIAGGIGVAAEGFDTCYTDLLGHGTAVAGAIREKAPLVNIYAVKIFDRSLATSGSILFRALDWCLDQEFDFINLSLGTRNDSYRKEFQHRIKRAQLVNCRIVAAYEDQGQPVFPGHLEGVVGVVLNDECPRENCIEQYRNGRIVYGAAGYPRSIPGLPANRNLQGVSFAVANVTGFLSNLASK